MKNSIFSSGPQRFLVATFFVLSASLFSPQPAEAGLGDSYLSFCRRVLANPGWIRELSLPRENGSPYWVTDPNDLTPVSEALVDAFSADPLFLWIAPPPKTRRTFIYTLVRHAFINGGVLTTDPPGAGAALWFESRKAPLGPVSIPLSGQGGVLKDFSPGHIWNLLRLDNFLVRTRKQLIRESGGSGSAIYLYMVGVRESERGRGLASRLLNPVLEYADSTGQIVLLETHKLSNLPLYRHFGFEIGIRKPCRSARR